MTIQKFSRENYMEMDSMHDFFASQILVEDKKLIIVYDNLDKDIFNKDGTPYYQHKKLTIEYLIDSYCDAQLYYNRSKSVCLDLLDEKERFDKALRNCTFLSYKYAVDSFRELILYFTVCGKSKYYHFEILLDPESVTYTWE